MNLQEIVNNILNDEKNSRYFVHRTEIIKPYIDILNGKTPYEAILLLLNEEEINKLGVMKIDADEVNLSPNLLKGGDK